MRVMRILNANTTKCHPKVVFWRRFRFRGTVVCVCHWVGRCTMDYGFGTYHVDLGLNSYQMKKGLKVGPNAFQPQNGLDHDWLSGFAYFGSLLTFLVGLLELVHLYVGQGSSSSPVMTKYWVVAGQWIRCDSGANDDFGVGIMVSILLIQYSALWMISSWQPHWDDRITIFGPPKFGKTRHTIEKTEGKRKANGRCCHWLSAS